MKIILCQEPGAIKYAEREKPVLKPGHAIIKIRRIGICGTDLHAFEGTQPYFNYPRVLGHELSGELIAFDGAPGFEINEKVTFIPYFSCGNCIACRSGNTNCCVNIKVCGVHIDGGMAEYLMVPSNSLLHGQGLNFDELALVEPLAISAHGIRRAGIRAGGEFVLVIGAGPIGLGAMEFARLKGARVIAMDINNQRLDFCRNVIKTDYVINGAHQDVAERLREITNGEMPTVVIDATGSQTAINNGFKYMAHGARYILVGLQKGDISFSQPEFHKREGTLMSSRNATIADFEYVIDSIKKKLVSPLSYITHRVDFNEVEKNFTGWLKSENGLVKAMISIENQVL